MSGAVNRAESHGGALTKADLAARVIWLAQPPAPRKHGRTAWTNQELRDLRLLLVEGKTYASIAQRLGRTRNSISGAVRRMRLGE